MSTTETQIGQSALHLLAKDITLGLKNLFMPAFCHNCRERILTEDNLYFCEQCWVTIELAGEPKCPRCGKPHPRRVGFDPVDNFVCSDCSTQKLWTGNTHAAGLHGGVLRDAIHLLKYGRKRLMSGPLADLLVTHVVPEIDITSYDAVVPVPLHGKRFKDRGYNQADLIANGLCSRIPGLKVQALLTRVKDTPSFSMLGARERHEHIKKAFRLAPDAIVKKKRLLLIDDVVTTGATTNECARVLRRAGAEAVDVIAVAVAGRV